MIRANYISRWLDEGQDDGAVKRVLPLTAIVTEAEDDEPEGDAKDDQAKGLLAIIFKIV